MTRPVYPPGVRFESGGCLVRAVKPVIVFLRGGSAARVGPAQRQRGLPVRELGTVGGRDPLNPPVTSGGQNPCCAKGKIAVWGALETSPAAGQGGFPSRISPPGVGNCHTPS